MISQSSRPLGTSPPQLALVQARSTREGLGNSLRNAEPSRRWSPGQHVLPLKPTIRRSVAAAQDSRQRWFSTLAHVKKCEKLRRRARAYNGSLKTQTERSKHGGSEDGIRGRNRRWKEGAMARKDTTKETDDCHEHAMKVGKMRKVESTVTDGVTIWTS